MRTNAHTAYDTAIRAIRTTIAVEDGMVWPGTPTPNVAYVRAQMVELYGVRTYTLWPGASCTRIHTYMHTNGRPHEYIYTHSD
jgi:hypothetical protein